MRWIAALAFGISEHVPIRLVWPATFAAFFAGASLLAGLVYLIINGG
jgi:uncharacterized membrane protein